MSSAEDKGHGKDEVSVGVLAGVGDFANAKKVWTIRRYASHQDYLEGNETDVIDGKGNKLPHKSVIHGNVLLNEGITALQNLLIGAAETAYDNANANIGVGNDGATAEAATQTGLQGVSTAFAGMEASYPQISGQATTWRAVFGGTEANFDWNEFTVVNAIDDTGDNLNRKVSNQGTKANGQTWTIDLTITWS